MIASPVVIALVSLVLPPTASVAPVPWEIPDDVAVPYPAPLSVADEVLSNSHGRDGFDLAPGISRQIVDERSGADFRTSGMISRTQMDVWWSTTGATLIAASVRSATPSS